MIPLPAELAGLARSHHAPDDFAVGAEKNRGRNRLDAETFHHRLFGQQNRIADREFLTNGRTERTPSPCTVSQATPSTTSPLDRWYFA